ncbi:hypothetical protein GCM10009700_35230 [Brevibacterium sanguinis]|uniref:hypothetical protein n=1 Tax=Brevibacterium sanguinis TaxID=232444 RepID=UPI0031E1868D
MDVQYMAYWLDGDGTQHLMDPDLPLQGVKITREMNGLGRLTASLPPEYGKAYGYSMRPVIQEWATAIYVEIDGDLFDGFIIAETDDDNEKLSIDAVGWLGYATGQPWNDRSRNYSVGGVPARTPIPVMMSELQRLRGANIGLQVSTDPGNRSWPIIGEPVWDEVPNPRPPGSKPRATAGAQPKAPSYPSYPTTGSADWKKKEYERLKRKYAADRKAYDAALKLWRARTDQDRKNEQAWTERKNQFDQDIKERKRMIEDAKFKMNYWSTHDLLQEFQNLSKEAGFSYRVDHRRSGNTHTHTLVCRPGRLGSRRLDVAFMEGENVYSVPKVTRQGDEKVTSAIVLGNGEGSAMKWNQTSRAAGGGNGLRRARVFADKTLTRQPQLAARAREILNAYNDPIDIDEFIVIDHGLAPIRVFDVGDEINLQTFARRAGNFNRWVTIQSITLEPEKNVMSVKVVPVEQE